MRQYHQKLYTKEAPISTKIKTTRLTLFGHTYYALTEKLQSKKPYSTDSTM